MSPDHAAELALVEVSRWQREWLAREIRPAFDLIDREMRHVLRLIEAGEIDVALRREAELRAAIMREPPTHSAPAAARAKAAA